VNFKDLDPSESRNYAVVDLNYQIKIRTFCFGPKLPMSKRGLSNLDSAVQIKWLCHMCDSIDQGRTVHVHTMFWTKFTKVKTWMVRLSKSCDCVKCV